MVSKLFAPKPHDSKPKSSLKAGLKTEDHQSQNYNYTESHQLGDRYSRIIIAKWMLTFKYELSAVGWKASKTSTLFSWSVPLICWGKKQSTCCERPQQKHCWTLYICKSKWFTENPESCFGTTDLLMENEYMLAKGNSRRRTRFELMLWLRDWKKKRNAC